MSVSTMLFFLKSKCKQNKEKKDRVHYQVILCFAEKKDNDANRQIALAVHLCVRQRAIDGWIYSHILLMLATSPQRITTDNVRRGS